IIFHVTTMPAKTRSSRIASFLAVFLVLAVLAALGASIWLSRAQAIDEWRAHLDSLSLVLAEQTSQEVSSAFLVLESIAESVQASDVTNAAELREKMGSLAHFNSMRYKTRGLPQVDVATIVAVNGDVINFTRAHPAPAINLADRDYFQAHLKQPKLGVYISTPVRNKGNGQWTFYLSRRLTGQKGEFIGLALVGFSSTFLSDFYSKINLGSGATVSLYRRDFTLLARWPHTDSLMGKKNLGGSSYQVIEQMKQTHGVVQTASPRFSADGEKIGRLGAVRLIDNYPLVINVTVTDELYLAQWRHFATALSLVGGFAALAMAAAFIVLIRSLRRRERSMEETRALKAVAEAANRAKSEFLAMMSHEIRTPLTAIIGFAEMMVKPQAAGASSNAGAVILRNGQHLLNIINDILDISKIEAGRLHIEHLAFSPLELVQGVHAMMGAQAASKGIGFGVKVDYPFPSLVMGDPTRWKQILFNLCSNAIKFTELGQVGLTLSYDPQSARLTCSVVDTGIGISDVQREQLFQPFSQADSTVARKYGGTGLGLHLVSQLAAKMGGGVAVASELGRGSTFDVAIDAPLATDSTWLSEAPPPPDTVRQGDGFGLRLAGHVLVAEDGPDNRVLVGAYLDGIGVSYELAENGAQAAELALAGGFDLILMDMQMPVMDGVQATGLLRAAGFGQPIIALTANVMADDVERYLAAGCSECLGKPIDFGALGELLARLLGQERPADAAASFEQTDGYGAIRAAFEASLAPRLAQLARDVGAQAWSDAADLAHQLKGSGGSFGYPGVTLAAGQLERAARRADAHASGAALARLLALDELIILNERAAPHVER
ncbi:MAG: ATP-binding protein, partial [Pseudomonadota bacterium]|nr:ATP-binding protein [Pseudomonadota bacterium]